MNQQVIMGDLEQQGSWPITDPRKRVKWFSVMAAIGQLWNAAGGAKPEWTGPNHLSGVGNRLIQLAKDAANYFQNGVGKDFAAERTAIKKLLDELAPGSYLTGPSRAWEKFTQAIDTNLLNT